MSSKRSSSPSSGPLAESEIAVFDHVNAGLSNLDASSAVCKKMKLSSGER